MSDAQDIVAQLDALYRAAVERLQHALTAYLARGTLPDPDARHDGSFAYPEIRLRYRGGDGRPTPLRSFGRLVTPGEYGISVTKPAMFADYLVEQLTLLIEDYDVEVTAAPGRQEIPFPYVLDAGHALSLDEVSAAELARWFPATELAFIGDEIADGLAANEAVRPLALFDGLRTDFSLAGCGIIPARRPSTSSATCCSPITTAMSTNSSAGLARNSVSAAASPRCRARAG